MFEVGDTVIATRRVVVPENVGSTILTRYVTVPIWRDEIVRVSKTRAVTKNHDLSFARKYGQWTPRGRGDFSHYHDQLKIHLATKELEESLEARLIWLELQKLTQFTPDNLTVEQWRQIGNAAGITVKGDE